jgi:hypothetical protein
MNKVKYHPNGQIASIANESLARYFDINGAVVEQMRFAQGVLHHPTEPAHIRWHDKKIVFYRYCKEGQIHRDGDAPAEFIDIGNKIYRWYTNGRLHRDNGPAVIEKDGRDVVGLQWYFHGKLLERW